MHVLSASYLIKLSIELTKSSVTCSFVTKLQKLLCNFATATSYNLLLVTSIGN